MLKIKTMEIIKMGVIPESQTSSDNCVNCGTEFRYDESDVQLSSSVVLSKNTYLMVKCPLCSNPIQSNLLPSHFKPYFSH